MTILDFMRSRIPLLRGLFTEFGWILKRAVHIHLEIGRMDLL